jgi:hypothetical protein
LRTSRPEEKGDTLVLKKPMQLYVHPVFSNYFT